MPQLSTAVRLLIAEIALPLALVCLADRAFDRMVVQAPDAPLPILFPYPATTAKYLAYRALAADPAPLDVLLMGMSQMLRANTRWVAETAVPAGAPRPRVFNFAAPLHSVEFDRRLLAEVLIPIKRPGVVVHGFLPKNLLFNDSPARVEELIQRLPAFTMHGRSPGALLYDFLFTHSALLQYREVIQKRLLLQPIAGGPLVQFARTIDRSGDILLSGAGLRVGDARVEQEFTERFASFPQVMDETTLFERIGDLARTCRQHGIRLVILNNPVHPNALSEFPHGRADYERFVHTLEATARAHDLPFLDPAPGGIGDPRLFKDTIHHNVTGARWLSERIGGFLRAEGLLRPARRD